MILLLKSSKYFCFSYLCLHFLKVVLIFFYFNCRMSISPCTYKSFYFVTILLVSLKLMTVTYSWLIVLFILWMPFFLMVSLSTWIFVSFDINIIALALLLFFGILLLKCLYCFILYLSLLNSLKLDPLPVNLCILQKLTYSYFWQ